MCDLAKDKTVVEIAPVWLPQAVVGEPVEGEDMPLDVPVPDRETPEEVPVP